MSCPFKLWEHSLDGVRGCLKPCSSHLHFHRKDTISLPSSTNLFPLLKMVFLNSVKVATVCVWDSYSWLKTKGFLPRRLSKEVQLNISVVVNTVMWKSQKPWVKALQNEKTGPDLNDAISWSDFGLRFCNFPCPSLAQQHNNFKASRAVYSLYSYTLSRNHFFTYCFDVLLSSLPLAAVGHFFSPSAQEEEGMKPLTHSLAKKEEGRDSNKKHRTVLNCAAFSTFS